MSLWLIFTRAPLVLTLHRVQPPIVNYWSKKSGSHLILLASLEGAV